MNPDQIARQISGEKHATARLSREARQGDRSHVIIHEIIDAASDRAPRQLGYFVEKRTTSRAEHELASALAKLNQDASSTRVRSLPTPQIFATFQSGDRHVIYQEFMSGIGLLPSRDKEGPAEVEPALAAAIAHFNRGAHELLASRPSMPPRAQILRRRAQSLLRSHAGIFTAREIYGCFAGIFKELTAWPLIMSHNDIHLGNISIENPLADNEEICLIDFGQLEWNYIGAELHHFAVLSCEDREISSGLSQGFFQRLSAAYGSQLQIPLPIVQAGAYAYAAHRTCLRLDSSPQGAQAELLLMLELLAKSEKLLNIETSRSDLLILLRSMSAAIKDARKREKHLRKRVKKLQSKTKLQEQ